MTTGKEIWSRLQKPGVAKKPPKPMKQKGRGTIEYEKWRDTVAKPYLDITFGRKCSYKGCRVTTHLEVDHIKRRGSHPELKMELTNVRYLCNTHHKEVT